MRSNDVFCYLIVATLAVLSTLGRAERNDEARTTRPCDTSQLMQCRKNERCRQTSSGHPFCDCERDFTFDIHGECVRITSTMASVDVTTLQPEERSESGGGSSVAAGLLIPTFLIVVGVLLYFGARRYKWLQRFRQYRHNRYGNVIVTRDDDDDDDDPPIA